MNEITRTDWRALPVGYFSPSQAWSFIACGACYEAERILKIPKPVSADLLIGRFAHSAVAQMRSTAPSDPADKTLPVFYEGFVEAGAAAFDRILEQRVDVEDTGEVTP